jgi:hypothetical protein
MNDFGPLAPLVGLVGSIAAAGLAIGFSWRGRAKWEPSEQDIANGPQRVGGLGSAVLVALLFVLTRSNTSIGLLPGLAFGAFVVSLVALLVYGIITSTQTYKDGGGRKIIGGTLTPLARRTIRERNIPTVQEYLAGVAYDPDVVWTRSSRAFAKAAFVLLYIVLIVAGSVAIASAAIAVEKATAPPPPAKPTVSERTLRWIDAPASGAVLDGGVYDVGKSVWLRELFPAEAPTSFRVVETLGAWVPQDARDALAVIRLPSFAPVIVGYQATSDAAWTLPQPISGIGYRTFEFTDANPDGLETKSGSISSGAVVVTTMQSSACTTVQPDGTYEAGVGDSGCVALAVTAGRDPTLDVTILLPWGRGDTDLLAAVEGYLQNLDRHLTTVEGSVGFDARAAFATFVRENEAMLPRQTPDGWDIVAPDLLQVDAGQTVGLRLDITRDSAASALIAVRLTNRLTGETFLSPLLAIVATGEPENGLPQVEILEPGKDAVGQDRYSYTGFENDMWFTDVRLVAQAVDPEDGVLSGTSIVWTTDRTDVQPADLGAGEEITGRLYSPYCESGVLHTISVTVRDAQGAEATATRQIEIGQVC